MKLQKLTSYLLILIALITFFTLVDNTVSYASIASDMAQGLVDDMGNSIKKENEDGEGKWSIGALVRTAILDEQLDIGKWLSDTTDQGFGRWYYRFWLVGWAFMPLILMKVGLVSMTSFVNPAGRTEVKEYVKATILYFFILLAGRELIEMGLDLNNIIVTYFKGIYDGYSIGTTIASEGVNNILGAIIGLLVFLATTLMWLYIKIIFIIRAIGIGLAYMLLPIGALLLFTKKFKSALTTLVEELMALIFQQAIYAGAFVLLYSSLCFVFKNWGFYRGGDSSTVKGWLMASFATFDPNTGNVTLGAIGWGLLLFMLIEIVEKMTGLFNLRTKLAPSGAEAIGKLAKVAGFVGGAGSFGYKWAEEKGLGDTKMGQFISTARDKVKDSNAGKAVAKFAEKQRDKINKGASDKNRGDSYVGIDEWVKKNESDDNEIANESKKKSWLKEGAKKTINGAKTLGGIGVMAAGKGVDVLDKLGKTKVGKGLLYGAAAGLKFGALVTGMDEHIKSVQGSLYNPIMNYGIDKVSGKEENELLFTKQNNKNLKEMGFDRNKHNILKSADGKTYGFYDGDKFNGFRFDEEGVLRSLTEDENRKYQDRKSTQGWKAYGGSGNYRLYGEEGIILTPNLGGASISAAMSGGGYKSIEERTKDRFENMTAVPPNMQGLIDGLNSKAGSKITQFANVPGKDVEILLNVDGNRVTYSYVGKDAEGNYTGKQVVQGQYFVNPEQVTWGDGMHVVAVKSTATPSGELTFVAGGMEKTTIEEEASLAEGYSNMTRGEQIKIRNSFAQNIKEMSEKQKELEANLESAQTLEAQEELRTQVNNNAKIIELRQQQFDRMQDLIGTNNLNANLDNRYNNSGGAGTVSILESTEKVDSVKTIREYATATQEKEKIVNAINDLKSAIEKQTGATDEDRKKKEEMIVELQNTTEKLNTLNQKIDRYEDRLNTSNNNDNSDHNVIE